MQPLSQGSVFVDTLAGGINDAGRVAGSWIRHGTVISPCDIGNGFLFGGGSFVPADANAFYDRLIT